MTTNEDTILANAAYAVEHTTPTGTDTTAPGAFVEWEGPDMRQAEDRHFIIDAVSAYDQGNTGLDGQVNDRHGYIMFNVIIRRINAGMSARKFAAAVLADIRGVTDRVQRYVAENTAGVVCVSESESVVEKFAEGEVTLNHCVIPFKAYFSATQIVG